MTPRTLDALVVIPARWGSSRFPGKPLAKVAGRSLIERVWRIARGARLPREVVVATDDARIAEHVASFGGRAVMTRPECRNGTERAHDALRVLGASPEVVLNLQGDAVRTPPWVLDDLLAVLRDEPAVEVATPAVRLSWEQLDALAVSSSRVSGSGVAGGTTVTFDQRGFALYFSKVAIPFVRQRGALCPVFRHIGIYAYRREALARWLTLEPTPLEETEQLEQLRWLEHGGQIRVVTVDYKGRTPCSIDRPEDVAVAEQLIAREGE